jgi:hypothetical protein
MAGRVVRRTGIRCASASGANRNGSRHDGEERAGVSIAGIKGEDGLRGYARLLPGVSSEGGLGLVEEPIHLALLALA